MSTDIIKYNDNQSSFSPKALGLFFTLCVPLMVFTFVATAIVYNWARIRSLRAPDHKHAIIKTNVKY